MAVTNQDSKRDDEWHAWMEGRKAAENGEPRQTDYADPDLIEAFGAGYDSVSQDK